MKKFSFKLQTVLGMREKILEEKQLEMAKILSVLNEQIQKLDNLISRKDQSKSTLEGIYESGAGLDILEITNYKNYLAKLTNDIKIQQQVIENTRLVLRSKQHEVNEALKEVKILEKLKEKQETKFYKHYEYVQAKEIDDIASTRYKRVAV